MGNYGCSFGGSLSTRVAEGSPNLGFMTNCYSVWGRDKAQEGNFPVGASLMANLPLHFEPHAEFAALFRVEFPLRADRWRALASAGPGFDSDFQLRLAVLAGLEMDILGGLAHFGAYVFAASAVQGDPLNFDDPVAAGGFLGGGFSF